MVTERYRVPLMWTFLNHSGNSTTQQRIALMRRYLARFNALTVCMFLADREFIGQEWFKFLKDENIPFAIRVKEDHLNVVGGREYSLRSYLSRCKGERGFTATFPAKAGQPALELHFGARRIKGGELLIVVCSEPLSGSRILRYYRWRWFIECMFADSKTKGLNLEDTRMKLSKRLSLLIAISAIALAMACHTASKLMGVKYPARKKHGYCSKSWFRTGFDDPRWTRTRDLTHAALREPPLSATSAKAADRGQVNKLEIQKGQDS
ncbi:transposase [Sedimentitalea sp.]|uniref:transposase n=1 Tax=Sedimentitalea sp. TaxID=2048915 RepID=UPI003298F05F